ncbi:MAG: enoyl-CoA hydratase/isomerase family protein [Acidobacteriota bacterium]|nr:enoyl-CoA hydratase/isomerase family protein [Acidobacteriota bacterium]
MVGSKDLGAVRLLSIAHGKANAFDSEFFVALDAALTAAEEEPVDAVVLTGTGSIFSAGVDLFRVLEGGTEYVEGFLPLLSDGLLRLFTFPKPVIAAVNGHAIAGGCVLACACDLRVGAAGNGKIGIPELNVGVPFPAAALGVMRFAVGSQRLPDLVFRGATYPADEAITHRLLDRLVPPEELVERAVAEATRLVEVGSAVFRVTKQQLREHAVEQILAQRKRTDARVLELWQQPATRVSIRDYLDRTLRR